MSRVPKRPEIWTPAYTLTPKVVSALLEIEAAKTLVSNTPLTPAVEAELRHRARVRSTHHSTRIEGNRLTLAQAEEVIKGKKTRFHGRERDVNEVQNYWNALVKVEEWAARRAPFTEDLVKRLHALVDKGLRSKPSDYRKEQNVIKESTTGKIVYLPPEAKDVPKLMSDFVTWVSHAEKSKVPAPVIAGLAHYQFVTIHPYYDGNGRTARLIATFLLQRATYGLNGFLSIEEHHARDLDGYYRSLAAHAHHNYYEGRAKADLTPWLEYFVTLLSGVFEAAKEEALKLSKEGVPVEPDALRRLDRRARAVLSLFTKEERITNADVARALGLSDRMSRLLCRQWVKAGWLLVANKSNRSRAYELSAKYRQYTGGLSATVNRKGSNRF